MAFRLSAPTASIKAQAEWKSDSCLAMSNADKFNLKKGPGRTKDKIETSLF
jgi:hypothetical protein